MDATEVVTDREKFLRLTEQCEEIIDTRKRLPEFVFRRPFANYFAVEYAHLYRLQFGQLLHELSNLFKDDSLSYMMVDPHPWDTVSFGLISFMPSTLPERYSQVMNPRVGCSKILAGANLGVFWGSSLNWAIFADRISWELAVIAVQKDVDVSSILGWPCFGAEQIKNYMTSQYHAKDPSDSIASRFNGRFFENYTI